jgi:ATP-binding cassette subfamily B protein
VANAGERPPAESPQPGTLSRALTQARQALGVLGGTPRALRLVWQAHPGYSVALVVVNVVRGLLPLAQLWLTRLVVDAVVLGLRQRSVATVTPLALHLAPSLALLILLWSLIALASQALQPLSTYIQTELGELLTEAITVRLLRKANSLLDISLFESPRFHDLVLRAWNEAGFRPLNMLQAFSFLLQSTISFVSTFALLLAFQPLLAVGLVVLLLPNLILQFRQGQQGFQLANWQTRGVRRMRYFSTLATDTSAAKELRLFGLGDFFLQGYQERFRTFYRERHHLRLGQLGWSVLPAFLSTLGAAAAYGYTVLATLAGRLSLGSLTLYVGAVGQVQSSLGGLIWQVASLYESNLFVSHLFEFLDLPPTLVPLPPGQAQAAPRPLRQGIEFRQVAFHYPGSERPVLRDISFTIRPGETVALVGENGAGKTTLVKLLTRLYDPTAGEILLDGVDLRAYDLADWREQIAVIFQDFVHYHLTARENIGLGRVERLGDQAAVEQAAERGGAAPVIARLAAGLETTLGGWSTGQDEGAELSGGEWQKVALARAFMRSGDGTLRGDSLPLSAQLLVLDEPTAALDVQAEEEVYRRFHELTRDRATLLISHRFATVKLADTILMLDDGHIIERGSHVQLLAQNGTYARLYRLQADRYQ